MNTLNMLPFNTNLDTVNILKQLAKTNRFLAELKGIARTMPNSKKAKSSSAIENIVTTHDEIYKAMVRTFRSFIL